MLIDLGAIKLQTNVVEDDLGIMEITLLAGADSGLHKHTRERETFYLLSGEIAFEIDGQEIIAKVGDTVSIPPYALHRFRHIGEVPAKALLLLNPGGLVHYFIELRQLIDQQAAPDAFAALNIRYGLEFVRS